MGTPAEYLPPALSAESVAELIVTLNLPAPSRIEPLQVTAEYHSIYLVHFPPGSDIPSARAAEDGSITLVLRVSGRHLPRMKTQNEVGVMTWVRKNTKIPIPAVIRFDDSDSNVIGHEFTLLEKAAGVSVDKVYDTLSKEAKRGLVEQLAEYLMELHAASGEWDSGCVGGLVIKDGAIEQGPPIDETFWQLPDIQKYWDGQTVESLNPIPTAGSFSSWASFNTASLECYIRAIESHASLEPYRDMIPRMRAFIAAINSPKYVDEVNSTKYILAHKDMHFANIMCDPATANITAVLDWEFSGVVPAPRWNPPRAFLWNGQRSDGAKEEQTALEAVFDDVCRARGAEQMLADFEYSNALQESMQSALNHIRAIVEVCPRGQAQDRVGKWRETAEAAMEAFGV